MNPVIPLNSLRGLTLNELVALRDDPGLAELSRSRVRVEIERRLDAIPINMPKPEGFQ